MGNGHQKQIWQFPRFVLQATVGQVTKASVGRAVSARPLMVSITNTARFLKMRNRDNVSSFEVWSVQLICRFRQITRIETTRAGFSSSESMKSCNLRISP